MGEHGIEETGVLGQSPCLKRLGVGVARESMVLRKEGSFVNMSHLGGGSLS